MPVLRRPVLLPRAFLMQTWADEELGDPHPVLGGDDVYVPHDDTGETTQARIALYTERGLARDGELTREFRRVLRLLSGAQREVYCWSLHPDKPEDDRAFLVAAGDGQAIAMEVRGELVAITPVDEQRFVDEFVFELPEYPPAQVRKLVVPRHDFTERNKPRDMFASAPSPAMELAEQMRQPRDAVHQIYAAGVFDGRFRRSLPVSLIDVHGLGRLLVCVDGHDTVQRLPGTPANLAATIVKTWHALA